MINGLSTWLLIHFCWLTNWFICFGIALINSFQLYVEMWICDTLNDHIIQLYHKLQPHMSDCNTGWTHWSSTVEFTVERKCLCGCRRPQTLSELDPHKQTINQHRTDSGRPAWCQAADGFSFHPDYPDAQGAASSSPPQIHSTSEVLCSNHVRNV